MHWINPSEPELSAQFFLQKIQDLNGYPLLCMFLFDDVNGCPVFSASHCALTVVQFWCQRVNSNPAINNTYRKHTHLQVVAQGYP